MQEWTWLPEIALEDEEIMLKVVSCKDANPEKRYVPAIHYAILLKDGTAIGKCNLRLGQHNDKLYFGGNIGYEIDEPYRGHHYAGKACKLLMQVAAQYHLEEVYISCVPENIASGKTCRWLGASYVQTAAIPEDNEMYAQGKRFVDIYRIAVPKTGA